MSVDPVTNLVNLDLYFWVANESDNFVGKIVAG